MVSITTNFTVEELEHIAMEFGHGVMRCDVCKSAMRKIKEAIELGTIAEEAKCQTLMQH